MPRIPVLPPEAMDAEQRRVYEDVKARTGRVAGGPSLAYIHSPKLWELSNAVGGYLENGGTLTKKELRIAAIVTCRHWNASFPWAAQARMAMDAGVDKAAVEAINAGERPKFSDPTEDAIYNVAREMVVTGNLSDQSFEAAKKALGLKKLVETVGVVGNFCKTAMMANLAGATGPDDAPSKLKP
jgi:4-carboxymuconolactone decarboxylase